MMSDERIDRVAAAARTELRRGLKVTPPDLDLLVRSNKRRRTRFGAIAVLALVALVVPFVLSSGDKDTHLAAGPPATPSIGGDGSNADLLSPGETRKLAKSPLSGRSTMAAVWTGDEMLIWGGDGPNGQLGDGAAYNPRSDSWTVLPDAPLSARNAPAAVWTGEEMLLWGGHSTQEAYRDGAAFNPTTRRWRTIPDAPFRSAGLPIGVWTGSEMIVIAGVNTRDAAAFDPASNLWRRLPDLPSAPQAPSPTAVWTGDKVITITGDNLLDVTDGYGSREVVALRPQGGAWTTVGVLTPGEGVLGWTDAVLIAASGDRAFEVSDGGMKPISSAPAGMEVSDAPAVWTGTQLIQWGGSTATAIDPVARTWREIPSGDSSHRIQPALVWADGVILAWGGFPDFGTGVMLRPPS